MEDWIKKIIESKKTLIDKIQDEGYFEKVEAAGQIFLDSIKNGGKILTAGNGGSAADAQHFTGEIVGRFLKERGPMAAITMTVDPTVMTCLGNDYGYDEAIARQVEGLGKKGDSVLLITTSGNSENMIRAAQMAKSKGINVIGLLGKDGGRMKELCDISLIVTTNETPRVQEIHTFTVHLLCQIIEDGNFS